MGSLRVVLGCLGGAGVDVDFAAQGGPQNEHRLGGSLLCFLAAFGLPLALFGCLGMGLCCRGDGGLDVDFVAHCLVRGECTRLFVGGPLRVKILFPCFSAGSQLKACGLVREQCSRFVFGGPPRVKRCFLGYSAGSRAKTCGLVRGECPQFVSAGPLLHNLWLICVLVTNLPFRN